VIRIFGLAPWILIPLVALAVNLSPFAFASLQETILQIMLPVLFTLLLVQLIITAMAWRARRSQALMLLLGMSLWAAGSLVLNSSDALATQFPSPGEWLFLASYAGLAAYVIMGGRRFGNAPLLAWLEAGIACGGAASLAGLAIASPLTEELGQQGLPLLAALVFPILDLTLLVLVLGQVIVGSRPLHLRTWLLLAGFAFLTIGDTSLVRGVSSGTYNYGLDMLLSWALSFLLLTGSAVYGIEHSHEPPKDEPNVPQTLPTGSVVVVAGAVALASLVYRPSEHIQPYLVVPAVLTLLAVGLRLILALRQAQQAAEARRLSRTDDLTGLPNRRALVSWLYERYQENRPLALLLLDLDRFKEINDSIGHAAGDTILQIIAQRLRRIATEHGRGTRVARLGGDEFALLVDESEPEHLIELAESLRSAVREQCRIEGLQLRIATSVGISVNDKRTTSGTDLLRRADIAMYQAKSVERGILLYDPDRDEFSRDRLQLAEDLRDGIGSDQLEVWYQPQVDAVTNRLIAVEALVRWQHPEQGLLSPGIFLPIARRVGLMASLTEYVLSRAIGDAIRWHTLGLPVRVAINVAPPELLTDGILQRLFDDVAASGLPRGTLVVEVTEETFISDPDRALSAIARLRRHGIEVSLDDYGTGYSSLAYLRNLNLNELKIDREFVKDILVDQDSQIIVAATNQLAHGLGMRTVAEGVENAEIAAALTNLGVNILQGFHFARPMPAQDIPGWVDYQQPATP
jgi:diguanylate cyclase (GGDEF)-like protein